MSWLIDLVHQDSVAHTVVLLSLAVFPGIWIGNLSVRGVKLGIAGVLFSGLAVGALGLPLNTHILHFVREFGLILFVFAVGLQVGPGFFANFRDQGLKLNGFATAIVLLGVALAWGIRSLFGVPVAAMVGILSGAVTNTPGLGAAQQALRDAPGLGDEAAALSGTGYAVAYPFGIFGIILVMLLVRWFLRIKVADEASRFEQERKGNSALQTFTIQIRNPMLESRSVAEFLQLVGGELAVSRLSRLGTVRVPTDDVLLRTGDLLHIVCNKDHLGKVTALAGPQADVDLRHTPSDLAVRQVLVSRAEAPSESLAQERFQERHGIRITRVLRSGVEFVPTAGTSLHVGDIVTAVGNPGSLQSFASELGDSQGTLEHPNLLPIFLGILCGVVLGSIPIAIPGLPTPVKLGMAGGPLIIALLMGFKRRLGSIHFYLPGVAGQFMREFGILLFLAAVGMSSGKSFVAALADGQGWVWMGYGAIITFVPLAIVGFWARLRGLNYLSLSGLLAGSMTDPPALGYANSIAPSQAQATAYASVYPLTMFLRVMAAQVFVMFNL